jgi:Type IV secretory system Conjugative DNA transfer
MSSRTAAHRQTTSQPVGEILILVAAGGLIMVGFAVWLAGAATVLVASGHAPTTPFADAPRLVAGISRHLAAPWRAWPLADDARMPHNPFVWWLVAVAPILSLSGLVAWVVPRIRDVARPQSGRMQRLGAPPRVEIEADGSKTRMLTRQPPPGRLVIGRHRRRLVSVSNTTHTAVFAPPGEGKTACIVINQLLEHTGQIICASTKTDVYNATRAHRATLGRVWMFDPFTRDGASNPDSCGWDPTIRCESWPAALQRAIALTNAARREHETEAGEFWTGVAKGLLAPLLMAAAIDQRTMPDLFAWLLAGDFAEPQRILATATCIDHAETAAALRELNAADARHAENRDNMLLSTVELLAVYRHPTMRHASRRDLTADAFCDGHANTLYIVAPEAQQAALAPVIVALLEDVYTRAYTIGQRTPWQPGMLFCLDETANIAPIRKLPGWLVQCRSAGMPFITVWHDLAQITARYGRRSGSVLSGSRCKIFLGAASDPQTIRYVRDTIGPPDHQHDDKPFDLRLLRGQALVLHRNQPPYLIRLRPWYQTTRLKRLARATPYGQGGSPR